MNDGSALSPRRAGELLAHFAFFHGEPRSAVARALGYPESIVGDVESLKAALSTAIVREDLGALRDLVRANDIVARRLRATRPKLAFIARDPGLEPPALAPVVSRRPEMAPIVRAGSAGEVAARERVAGADVGAQAVPSYLHGTVRDGGVSPPPFVPPPVARPKTDVSTTSMAAISTPNATVGVGAVPFRPADPALAAPPLPPSPPKPRIDTGTAPADGPLVDFSNLPQARSKRLAEPPPPTSDPNWTLGRFVELTVALAATPDRASALTRFGLNEESHRAVATEWGGRITSDPALRLRFDELVRAKRTQGV